MFDYVVWSFVIHPSQQDRGVRQDCFQEQKNPSEQAISQQVDAAASMWKDMDIESEIGLVPDSSRQAMGSASANRQGQSSAVVQPKAKAKRTAKGFTASGAATPAQLLCFAAKQRAKTAKDFSEVERYLSRAIDAAERILSEVAPKLLDREGAEGPLDDPSLDLVKSRLALASLAASEEGGPEAEANSKKLFETAMKDPYLKDLRDTVFSDSSAVQTIGALNYARRVTFDLFLAWFG